MQNRTVSAILIIIFISIGAAAQTNLALNKKATASSVYKLDGVEYPDFIPEKAFDGDPFTRWTSEYTDPQWIMVDLGDVYQIDLVILCWEYAAGKAYTIDVSVDSLTWNSVFSTTEGIFMEIKNILFDPCQARYVRMNGTERVSNFGYSLYEFQVFNSNDIMVPVSDFGMDTTQGALPFAVQFTDSSEGDILTWMWHFGDGQKSPITNPSHLYETADTFTVSLYVTGPGGEDTEIKEDCIITFYVAPVAAFSADTTSGNASLKVQFSDSSTGLPEEYSWDFGDGKTSRAQNPSHTYKEPGTYTVSLTVTNEAGSDTKVIENMITVNQESNVTDNQPIVPSEFQLYPVYPNPFNPVAHICFDLPKHADVEISMYNIHGERIAIIDCDKMQAGCHMIDWDASKCSSGTYLIQFSTNGCIKSQKCVLLK